MPHSNMPRSTIPPPPPLSYYTPALHHPTWIGPRETGHLCSHLQTGLLAILKRLTRAGARKRPLPLHVQGGLVYLQNLLREDAEEGNRHKPIDWWVEGPKVFQALDLVFFRGEGEREGLTLSSRRWATEAVPANGQAVPGQSKNQEQAPQRKPFQEHPFSAIVVLFPSLTLHDMAQHDGTCSDLGRVSAFFALDPPRLGEKKRLGPRLQMVHIQYDVLLAHPRFAGATRLRKRTVVIRTLLHHMLHAYFDYYGCWCRHCKHPTAGERARVLDTDGLAAQLAAICLEIPNGRYNDGAFNACPDVCRPPVEENHVENRDQYCAQYRGYFRDQYRDYGNIYGELGSSTSSGSGASDTPVDTPKSTPEYTPGHTPEHTTDHNHIPSPIICPGYSHACSNPSHAHICPNTHDIFPDTHVSSRVSPKVPYTGQLLRQGSSHGPGWVACANALSRAVDAVGLGDLLEHSSFQNDKDGEERWSDKKNWWRDVCRRRDGGGESGGGSSGCGGPVHGGWGRIDWLSVREYLDEEVVIDLDLMDSDRVPGE